MAVKTRIGSLLNKVHLQVSPRREDSRRGIPVPELLSQMDAYDWASVEDIAVSEDERGKRTEFRYVHCNTSIYNRLFTLLFVGADG